jgi:hypothetical protein
MSATTNPIAPRHRPLKVGLFLPTGDTMFDGGTARWADLLYLEHTVEWREQ